MGQAFSNFQHQNGTLFSISNHQQLPVLDVVFAVHCYIINSPNLSSLKQPPYITAQFCRSEVLRGSAGLCSKYHKVKTKVLTGWALVWRLWRRTYSKLIQDVDRIQRLEALCLRPSVLCWLSAVDRSLRTYGHPHSFSRGPSIFKRQQHVRSFLHV